MSFQWLKKCVVALTFVISSNSFAGVITDVESVNKLATVLSPASWTHNILDQGFTTGTAQSATLSIQLWDDQKFDLPELASIVIGIIDFKDGAWIYNPVADWNGGLGASSIADLNADGKLNINVFSWFGDFRIGSSTLTVITKEVNVPEPSSIALIALGFLGLVLMRRKMRA